jgi:hypothetical protein
MKVTLKIEKEFDVKYLAVTAGIRYAEDVEVNGEQCSDFSEIPCHAGGHWQIIIDVDRGIIVNWHLGKTAEVYAKVCDDGSYSLLDNNKQEIKTLQDCYVPGCLAINDRGFGDYIIMTIESDGAIKNWKANFDEFIDAED